MKVSSTNSLSEIRQFNLLIHALNTKAKLKKFLVTLKKKSHNGSYQLLYLLGIQKH